MQEQRTHNAFSYFLLTTLGLLPFFLIPWFFNPLITSKFLLLTAVSFGSVFWLVFSVLRHKQISLHLTPVFWPLLVFAGAVLISSLTSQQYPDKQLLGLGGLLLMLSSLSVIAPSLLGGDRSRAAVRVLNWSGVGLGLLSIAQVFGLGLGRILESISILSVPNTLVFSLAGSAIVMVKLLSTILVANVLDRRTWQKSWLNRGLLLVIAIALGVNIRAILPGGQAAFSSLPFGASVEIARNSLYVTRTAFFGYGPDSYANAFHALKPLWLNNSTYWQSSFDGAVNLPLTFVVTIGGVGLAAWLWLCYRLVRLAWQSRIEQKALAYFVLALLIWQFFLPVGPLFFGLLFIAVAVLASADSRKHQVKSYSFSFFNQQGERHQLVDRIFTGLAVVVAGLATLMLVNLSRAFIASHHIYQANAALLQEDAVTAYESWQQAANVAPRLDFIRRNYALINLEIAIALSNKTDATAAEQEQVVQLVNQAIREARAAATLDPANHQNWLVLAQIYTQLVESSEQAAQEAFNALANAVNANPNDPLLRLSLGELFVMLDKPNDAIAFFNQAIERKPDLVSAYYALAQVLRQAGALAETEQALVAALSLLEEDSEDHRTVAAELDTVRQELATQAESGGGADMSELDLNSGLSLPEDEPSPLSNILGDSLTDEALREQAVDSDLGL